MDLKKLKTQLYTKERVDILFKKSIIYWKLIKTVTLWNENSFMNF